MVLSDRQIEIKCLTNIARSHTGKGAYAPALELLQRAALLARELGDKPLLSRCYIFTVSCTFNVLIYFLWWRFYILTLPLFQGMAIPCHKPFYDTKDGDGRLSENPSSCHRCRYSLLKITPPRFSVILQIG